jgi:hypothetical protein
VQTYNSNVSWFAGFYAMDILYRLFFIINHANKYVSLFNLTPTPEWYKDIPLNFFWKVILLISKKYKAAYGVKRIGWSHDIYMWRHSIRPDAPIDLKG